MGCKSASAGTSSQQSPDPQEFNCRNRRNGSSVDSAKRYRMPVNLLPAAADIPDPLPVVCFAFGDFHGMTETYVSRLFGMLSRHCPHPFRLYCYTDRPRQLPMQIEQRDCGGWSELVRDGMRPTTRKLGLFNPGYVEFDRFLYLDISLIVRRDMSDLLAQAFARAEDLVIVSHWRNEGYNSSVMRIRREGLGRVYDAFVRGEVYEQCVPGDQDFIHGAVVRHQLQRHVGHFPVDQIASFKDVVRVGRRSAAQARQVIERATIVKFHGSPKMHEAFALRYGIHLRVEEVLHGNIRPVMPLRQLRQEWLGRSPGI